MDILTHTIIPSLVTGVLSGLICLWIGHRLGRGGESVDRRRNFRAELRNLGSMAREQHAMYLWKFYRDYRDEVRRVCHAVESDVPLMKRRKFRRLVDRFLGLSDDDLKPEHGLDTDDKETRKRKFQQVCVNLQNLLNDIADAA